MNKKKNNNSIGGLLDYRLKAMHEKKDLKTTNRLRFDLHKLLHDYGSFRWELIDSLFYALELLIAEEESKRTEEDPTVFINVYSENGSTVYHLSSD